MLKVASLTDADMLEMLSMMSLPQAIPWLLKHSGGQIGIPELLEFAHFKTLSNVLALLTRKGVITVVGSMVYLVINQDSTEDQPRVTFDETESHPRVTRESPESHPKSGNNVQDEENSTLSRARGRDVLSSSVLGFTKEDQNPKNKKQKTSREKKNIEPPEVKEPEPRPRDLMFDAIGLACYGGLVGLTESVCKQIGAAKKALEKSGYSSADVPQIALWLEKNESWKSVTPRVLVEVAPSWKNGKTSGSSSSGTRKDDKKQKPWEQDGYYD